MFSTARELGVEGIVFFVRSSGDNSIQFVRRGRLAMYKPLFFEEACMLRDTLTQHATLQDSPSGREREGFVLLTVAGEYQLWKIYVIPEKHGTDVLLRFQVPDPLVPMEAVLGLPHMQLKRKLLTWQVLDERRIAAIAAVFCDEQDGSLAPRAHIQELLAG